MKKIFLVATAVVAGTAAVFYFMRNKKAPKMHPTMDNKSRSHHITDVFAKAKMQE